MRRLVPVTIVAAMIASLCAPTVGYGGRRPRARKQTELKQLLGRARSIMSEVQDLDQRIVALERSRLDADERLLMLRESVVRTRQLVAEAEEQATAALHVYRQRLLAYRQQSPALRNRILLGSPGVPEALRRAQLLRVIARHDRLALERYEAQRQRSLQLHDGLLERSRQAAQLEKELSAQQDELASMRLERTRMLKVIDASAELRRRIGAEFVDASGRLAELVLAKASAQVERPGAFGGQRGRLPRPTAGTVVRSFGKAVDPRFNTVTVHNGVDFEAPLGTPVSAVYQGSLAFTGWVDGYGQLAIVDHGDAWFTIYGHLSRSLHQVGETVEAGELLGFVGDSGSLQGPRLYFEIRHHGTPQNPADWIR